MASPSGSSTNASHVASSPTRFEGEVPEPEERDNEDPAPAAP